MCRFHAWSLDGLLSGGGAETDVVRNAAAVLTGLLCIAASWSSTGASAQWQVDLGAGFDGTVSPDLTGHGFAFVDARRRNLLSDHGGDLRLIINTDTLEVGLEQIPLHDRVQLSVALRGEAFLAGVLSDYYQRGARIGDNGFRASYFMGIVRLRALLSDAAILDFDANVARYFFSGASSNLVLPPDLVLARGQLSFLYWKASSPGDEWRAGHIFPRFVGSAFRISAQVNVRSDDRSWGAAGDPRNNPDTVGAILSFFGLLGHRAGPVRSELALRAAYGVGHDDITRDRLGGFNPYVVPVPGLAWPALLSERYAVATAKLGFLIHTHELGAMVSAGATADPARSGALGDWGGLGGAALYADLRFGSWQVHLYSGAAFPADWLDDGPNIGAMLALGYLWH